MKLTKQIKEDLVEKVFAKTEKAADCLAIKKAMGVEAKKQIEAWLKEKHPDFIAAIPKLPKEFLHYLDTVSYASFKVYSWENPVGNTKLCALFKENTYRSFAVDISPLYKPHRHGVPDIEMTPELWEMVDSWYEKYTNAEEELRTVLDQCNTAAKLEAMLPDVAQLLPKVTKAGLPAILPEKAKRSLAAIGFPPK